MCVENLSEQAEFRVKAWKLFATLRDNSLGSLCYPEKYNIGQIYVSAAGPGFQAFVRKEDAIASLNTWNVNRNVHVYAVFLYGARKGTIRWMDEKADGKPGWLAQRMKVLPKSNV